MIKKLLSIVAVAGILVSCTYHEQLPAPDPEAEAVMARQKEILASR